MSKIEWRLDGDDEWCDRDLFVDGIFKGYVYQIFDSGDTWCATIALKKGGLYTFEHEWSNVEQAKKDIESLFKEGA